jgi:hypothetical protein
MVFVEYKSTCGSQGNAYYPEEIKMKPLTWVEGKPVYKGDVLYLLTDQTYFVITGLYKDLQSTVLGLESKFGWIETGNLTWSKKHVHQDLIDAYNKGVKIQCFNTQGIWTDISWVPDWGQTLKYRIKPTKKSGWINLWGYTADRTTGGEIYSTKEQATAGLSLVNLVDTIEIHWEE